MKSNGEHTPGPWEVQTVPTQVGHCHKIMPLEACIYVDQQRLPRDKDNAASREAMANARLIAAAPDLLAALLLMVPYVKHAHSIIQDTVYAAISKAEGGTPCS